MVKWSLAKFPVFWESFRGCQNHGFLGFRGSFRVFFFFFFWAMCKSWNSQKKFACVENTWASRRRVDVDDFPIREELAQKQARGTNFLHRHLDWDTVSPPRIPLWRRSDDVRAQGQRRNTPKGRYCPVLGLGSSLSFDGCAHYACLMASWCMCNQFGPSSSHWIRRRLHRRQPVLLCLLLRP